MWQAMGYLSFFIESSFASGQVAGCNMKIQDVKYGTGHSS